MMETRKSYVFLILFILLNVAVLNAQEKVRANIIVFEPLPEISFAAFLTNPFIQGTPRIFQIQLSPHGVDVVLIGTLKWQKPNQGSYLPLITFKTKTFKSRDFYNDDINSSPDIQIDNTDYDDDLLQENLKLGKPTGQYTLMVQVLNTSGELLDEKIVDLGIKEYGFVNPAQTLEIIQPLAGSFQNAGGVILTWSEVIGVSDFIILANERTNKYESLEEALKKGNPIIDNKSVGLKTSVNLREYLDRELVPGQEIVVQVRGIIPNPGGQNILYSDILNFNITDHNSTSAEKVSDQMVVLLEKIINEMKNNPPDVEGEEQEEMDGFIQSLEELLRKLRDGDITFDEMLVTTKSGGTLTYPEFIQLLEKLVRYPNLITNINFEEK